ncbi:MAG: sulfatase-like hydrolase/transferase, partial [Myxococcota bacterium]
AALATPVRSLRARRWLCGGAFALAIALALVVGREREGLWERLGPPVDPPPRAEAVAREPAPNLVVVTIDTLRRDHLSLYGYERATTPFLDGFAREGAVFEQAISHAPATLRSMASLVTGVSPRLLDADHASRGERGAYVGEGMETLAERLAEAGYDTAAFVSNVWLKRTNGFAQGHAAYHDAISSVPEGGRSSVDRMLDAARPWLRRAEPPFFLWLHVTDPHHPYEPSTPGPWEDLAGADAAIHARYEAVRGVDYTRLLQALPHFDPAARERDLRYLIGRYDAEILQVDRALARLAGMLPADADGRGTAWVVTADHGEEFLDHGDVLHGKTLFDEVIRVPLVLRGPGIPAGRRVQAQVRMVDVTATVLDWAGLPAGDLHGGSLLGLFEAPVPEDRPAVASLGTRYCALRTPDRKLIVSYDPYPPGGVSWNPLRALPSMAQVALGRRRREEVALFDLSADPRERHDLFTARRDEARALYADLARERERTPLRRMASHAEAGLSERDRELLRGLGYLE